MKCVNCSAVVDTSSYHGNVGEIQIVTNWRYSCCNWTQKSVWLCPTCFLKAQSVATELLKIVKTPHYYLLSLFSKEEMDQWEQSNP